MVAQERNGVDRDDWNETNLLSVVDQQVIVRVASENSAKFR